MISPDGKVDVPNVDLTRSEIDDATIERHLESPLLYKAVWAHQGIGVSGSIARTIAVPDSGLQHLVAAPHREVNIVAPYPLRTNPT